MIANNPGAQSIWMAGARIRGGQAIGASDEFGYKAEQQVVTGHDLHATILYQGRQMRLTDVYGEPVPQIVKT